MASWHHARSYFTVPPSLLLGIWIMAGALPWNLHKMMQPVVASEEPCFPALFVFGDSLSDTGNGVLTGNVLDTRTKQFPYGESFPGGPSGRFSDGRLLVDYLATYLRLPLLNPSLNRTVDFSKGANYAVSGARALNASYLNSRNIITLGRDYSLAVQIGWHLALRKSKPSSRKPSIDAFDNGLYALGIGGNDYLNAVRFSLFTPQQVTSQFVPLVIDSIRQAAEALYSSGARHFLFFSIPPLGCSPVQLNVNPNGAKDSFGCLVDLNALAFQHHSKMQKLVQELRAAHSDAEFFLADYYNSYEYALRNSASYGFTDTLDACCGAGQAFSHNFNVLLFCNMQTVTTIPSSLCHNQNAYFFWDGIHFTDRFNSLIFNLTIRTHTYLDPSQGFNMCKP